MPWFYQKPGRFFGLSIALRLPIPPFVIARKLGLFGAMERNAGAKHCSCWIIIVNIFKIFIKKIRY